jgi:hypothetical protein
MTTPAAPATPAVAAEEAPLDDPDAPPPYW